MITIWKNDSVINFEKATPDSVGTDLFIQKEIVILSHTAKIIDLGIVIDFSKVKEPVAMQIIPRSSLFLKKGLILANSIGLFEKDYCGKEDTVKMILYNVEDLDVSLLKGEKIGQFYFVKIYQYEKDGGIEIKDNRFNNNKTRGGVGSSGGYK